MTIYVYELYCIAGKIHYNTEVVEGALTTNTGWVKRVSDYIADTYSAKVLFKYLAEGNYKASIASAQPIEDVVEILRECMLDNLINRWELSSEGYRSVIQKVVEYACE